MDSMPSRSEDWLLDTLNTELARLNDRLAEMTPLVQRRDAVQTAIDALNGRLTTAPTVAKGRPLGWGKRRAQVVDILRQARHAGITAKGVHDALCLLDATASPASATQALIHLKSKNAVIHDKASHRYFHPDYATAA